MRVIAALLLSSAAVVSGLDICGNYCGPTWCSGEVIPECADVSGSGCKQSSANCQERGATDGSCADACCRTHDACCGSTNREPCNNALIACLGACSGGKSCYRDGIPISPELIKIGMELDPEGCCGTSC